LFPLLDFQKEGGSWSIGTDSHVGLNPLEELRILDYGQRLISHKRNIFTSANQGDSGRFAVEMATLTGRKAMNNYSSTYFEIGQTFNASVISNQSPLLSSSSSQNLLSSILYTADSSNQLTTIVNGVVQIQNGQHINGEQIKESFLEVMKQLKNR
jgi:formimidoylglutamate deiminase